MTIILKILATILGGLALAKTTLAFRAKEDSLAMTIFWFGIWALVIVVAWRPNIIEDVIDLFDGRSITVGQIAGIGFILLIFILYRLYLKSHRIEQKIVAITRSMALEKLTGKINKK